MPIFEYRCQDCGAIFEILTLSSSAGQENVRCNICASGKVHKLISAGNIRQGKNSAHAPPAAGCSPRGGFS
jgi:putative FmdB family regulatory protein